MKVFGLWLLTVFSLAGLVCGGDLTSRPGGDGGVTNVEVRAVVLDLEEVRGAEQSFTASFAWVAGWVDERLRHDGDGPKRVSLNEIWHPQIQILNRRSLQDTFEAEAMVSPEGRVSVIQRVWGQFSQPLSLRDFPYDRQELRIELVAAGHEPGMVELVADSELPSGVATEFSITDWKLEGWEAGPVGVCLFEGGRVLPAFAMRLDVARQHRYHLVNIILPLAMIIGMSWVVFWFAPKNLNPRVSVSVTAMLTLIAYRFAVGASLPKIGYLTRMDWFILGSSVLVFTSLAQVVVTTHLAETDRNGLAVRINRWMRVAAPVAFALIVWASLGR